ncbi:MAG TPA: glycosyltransferase family 2 protein [Flavitalea sp.]|nr:glycosyltransferase family 2 protein [Flavitalea sp.]
MDPSVAIVILNWNGRGYLEQFLPSVTAGIYSNQTIVLVDNASTDDSVAFVQSAYPQVRILLHPVNYGFAKGYNEALKQLEFDYYVLLNSDVEVTSDWIRPIVRLMESDTKIGACAPKLLQYHDRRLFEYAGAAGGWLDHLGYPFAKGRIFDACEADSGQYDVIEPVFWASGAALFVRARVYHLLGGLDEYFFAHQEEIDLCWRMQRAGYSVYSCPESVVYHVGGGTLPKGNHRKVFLNFRNNLIMMAKNLPIGSAILKISIRFGLDLLSALKSLLAGEGTYFWAVIKAHGGFLYWLIMEKKTRSIVKKGYRLSGYLRKSIVWQHFVLGRRAFSEIVKRKSGFLS